MICDIREPDIASRRKGCTMKRFLLTSFVGVTALTLLAACGGEGTATADDDRSSSSTSPAGSTGSTVIAEGRGKQKLGSAVYELQVSATEQDGEVSGSGSIATGDIVESITVECSGEEGDIVTVGGTFENGPRAVKTLAGFGGVSGRVAFLIKDLDPDRLSLWFEERPPADDCNSMLAEIPRDVMSNEDFFQPLVEGDFSIGE